MNAFVVSIVAVGITISQIFTRPIQQFKTQFDANKDSVEIQQLLHDGCVYATNEMHAGSLNLDSVVDIVISTLKDERQQASKETSGSDTGAPAAHPTFFRKIAMKVDPEALQAAYKQFCKGETVENSPIKMDEVIDYYNKTLANLPDANQLKGMRLKESSNIVDRDGVRFSEIYSANNRRRWLAYDETPEVIKQAFVAAEDKRFRTHDIKDSNGKIIEHVEAHHGVDLLGVLRAFVASMTNKDRPQGGSTITQQVVKNLLVGDDLTFERKIREMVVAARVEQILSKNEILELYLNQVFLGRASWGIEMGAQSYFGHSARNLTLAEASLLVGLTRGPNAYNPDLFPDKLQERREYVLSRMNKDQYISDSMFQKGVAEKVAVIPFVGPHTRAGYYFLDEIQRESKAKANISSLTDAPYTVHATLNQSLQKSAEAALQNGLVAYERAAHRIPQFAAEGSLVDDMSQDGKTWQETLPKVHGRFYDIQWPLAVILPGAGAPIRKGHKLSARQGISIGLADVAGGRELPLVGASPEMLKVLKPYDLVYVQINDTNPVSATIQVPPEVQGAVVAIEARTGRILAMAGGFSYATVKLNHVTRTVRQPGSTLKPFTYLAALNLGFQPNTEIPDGPILLPPLNPGDRVAKLWNPHNFDGKSTGTVTARRAVERSLNRPTVHVMSQILQTPEAGLNYIRDLTQKLGIYQKPQHYYSFVLGAQPTRLLDIAAAYATIANIGLRPTPHVIDSIEQDGKMVYQVQRYNIQPIPKVDRISFYQIRHILEGTVERGTAVKLKDLGGFVAGKTGTSSRENDAWFVGFTNDLVVAAWVGYDNRHIAPSLGGDKFTGAGVALPIAEKVLRDSFTLYKYKEPLSAPPPEIMNQIAEVPIDPYSGQVYAGNYPEIFRLDTQGQPYNTSRELFNSRRTSALDFTNEEVAEEDVEPLPTDFQEDDTAADAYEPGAEDMYDLWHANKLRRVDDVFAGSLPVTN